MLDQTGLSRAFARGLSQLLSIEMQLPLDGPLQNQPELDEFLKKIQYFVKIGFLVFVVVKIGFLVPLLLGITYGLLWFVVFRVFCQL